MTNPTAIVPIILFGLAFSGWTLLPFEIYDNAISYEDKELFQSRRLLQANNIKFSTPVFRNKYDAVS